MASLDAERELPFPLPDIRLADRVLYFPIRHHSPACAWHLERVLESVRPEVILIEGPRNANTLVPLLASAETTAPVAIYANYSQPRKGKRPARHAAYYPFCDYSPELLAIRVGTQFGADVRFIDLSYPEMVIAETEPNQEIHRSLLDESYFRHSERLRHACSRLGARDPDDLWDGLFETNFQDKDTETFIREVLAYCSLARHDHSEAQLESDGTLARERAMSSTIHTFPMERVLVLTGGFHTVALASATGVKTPPPEVAEPLGESQTALIRYSFPQLDRLNGYASGMPMPGYYQYQWQALKQQKANVMVKLTVTLARTLRKEGHGISPADEIACVTHIHQLAQLRSHAQPSREDFLDGVRSVFIKGEHDVEGLSVLAAARKLLGGSLIGTVPPEAGRPPIVNDFFKQAALHRLDADSVTSCEVTLDLYRKRAHRQCSHFMHQLVFLEIPFSDQTQGPDFVQGENLDRVREVWSYQWHPAVEAGLIELSRYGATLREAASECLLERFERAESQGQGRDAALATALLIEACRMGMHRDLDDLLKRTGTLLQEDARCTHVITALGNLAILRSSVEPLEAHQLQAIPDLAETAYARACYLLPTLAQCQQEDHGNALNALKSLLEWVSALTDSPRWQSMRWGALRNLWHDAQDNPCIRGGALGLLYAEGQVDDDAVTKEVAGHLAATTGDEIGAQFLLGLLHTAREVLWRIPQVLEALHGFLADCGESTFQRAIPHLRLAFSALSGRETDQVARSVQESMNVTEADLNAAAVFDSYDFTIAAQVDEAVLATVRNDRLEDWLELKD